MYVGNILGTRTKYSGYDPEILWGRDYYVGRVSNEKIDINETNWTPNQYTEYLNLYIETAKRAALNP